MSKLLDILESIPEVKKEDVIKNRLLLEDIEKIHPTLTLYNPLTYFIYLYREKDLSIEDRNVIFKIIAKLKKNNIILNEAMVEKHNMEDHVPQPEVVPEGMKNDFKEFNITCGTNFKAVYPDGTTAIERPYPDDEIVEIEDSSAEESKSE